MALPFLSLVGKVESEVERPTGIKIPLKQNTLQKPTETPSDNPNLLRVLSLSIIQCSVSVFHPSTLRILKIQDTRGNIHAIF